LPANHSYLTNWQKRIGTGAQRLNGSMAQRFKGRLIFLAVEPMSRCANAPFFLDYSTR